METDDRVRAGARAASKEGPTVTLSNEGLAKQRPSTRTRLISKSKQRWRELTRPGQTRLPSCFKRVISTST